jgi:hypothetical protein
MQIRFTLVTTGPYQDGVLAALGPVHSPFLLGTYGTYPEQVPMYIAYFTFLRN